MINKQAKQNKKSAVDFGVYVLDVGSTRGRQAHETIL